MDCNSPSIPVPPTTTEIGLDLVNSLCASNHPANVLTGIVLKLLQDHFTNPDLLEYNGENEFEAGSTIPLRQLQSYVWNGDPKLTKIQIQPVWAYNPEDIQRRPALYVKRNTMRTQRMAINDGQTVGSQKDPKTGKVIAVRGDYKTVMVLGSHTVFCVGSTGAEAELLGMEVMGQLMMFAPLIRQDMKFHKFMVMECGELALLDEFDQHFVVPVVVSYAFAWAWRITKIAPWLQKLSISVTNA
jgi:hypothetical protein